MSRQDEQRRRGQGRVTSGTFLLLPHDLLDSKNFLALRGNAVKLLLDVARQFNGTNNGDLCIAWSYMNQRGWRSKTTLYAALDQLLDYGLLMVTRHGGLNIPSLFALTWKPINLCQGKLEVPASSVAPGTWRLPPTPNSRPRACRTKAPVRKLNSAVHLSY